MRGNSNIDIQCMINVLTIIHMHGIDTAIKDDFTSLEHLLKYVNTEDISRKLLLTELVKDNNHELLKTLLSLNIGLSIDYTQGDKTAITYAVEHGYIDIVKLLLDNNANIGRHSLLSLSLQNGHIELFKTIVQHPTYNKLSISGEPIIKHLINERYNNMTPLMVACSKGYLGIVELIIKLGADTTTTTNQKSALHYAMDMRHYTIVKLLITYKH